MATLGLLGLACLAWFVAAATFNLSLVTFATGSMAPTIPTGSLAIVREIPASELQVGDVATLERAGQGLPVTHRVTGVAPRPGDADTMVVTMQGDANPIADLFPYHVDSARLVLWSVPNAAAVAQNLSNPLLLGGLTIASGGLVLWTFWPGTRRSTIRAAIAEG